MQKTREHETKQDADLLWKAPNVNTRHQRKVMWQFEKLYL